MRGWVMAARQSFWFLPAVLGVVAVVLAEGLVAVDRVVGSVPFLDSLSASGARAILTTIGGSMLTVAGTSFSITISVLATTSSTYGPRLVRNFMADRSNQLVLATFTSTFLYCIVALRSVRTSAEGRGAFVPTLGVQFAVLLAVLDVAVLIYFIHHIATSVQITTLQKRVQTDLVHAVDRTHPARLDGGWTRTAPPAPPNMTTIVAARDGYVQRVDFDALLRAASRSDVLIEVAAMPGDHLVPTSPLVRVAGSPDGGRGAAAKRFESSVRSMFSIGAERTPEQDVRFALQQLVESAIRGLATGTNDPYTAVSALHLSRTALLRLVEREEPPRGRTDDEGRPRLLVAWPGAAELAGGVVDALRHYGLAHPAVVRVGLDLGGELGSAARSTAVRARLADAVRQLLRAYAATADEGPELVAMRARGDRILGELAPR